MLYPRSFEQTALLPCRGPIASVPQGSTAFFDPAKVGSARARSTCVSKVVEASHTHGGRGCRQKSSVLLSLRCRPLTPGLIRRPPSSTMFGGVGGRAKCASQNRPGEQPFGRGELAMCSTSLCCWVHWSPKPTARIAYVSARSAPEGIVLKRLPKPQTRLRI